MTGITTLNQSSSSTLLYTDYNQLLDALKSGTRDITTSSATITGNLAVTTLSGILKANGASSVSALTAPSGTIVGTTDTQTLTNKRNTPRVYTTTSTSTLTPEIASYDVFHLTAQAASLTIANPSTSTPTDGELMRIRILDNGTARTISFGTAYVAKAGVALPTTTTISKNMVMLFEYNANLSKWNLLALGQEA